MAASQDDGWAPLLFTAEPQQPAEFRTPRAHHSPLRESGTISSARRSVTPPGSVHTDTTPSRPPPMARLNDIQMAGEHMKPLCWLSFPAGSSFADSHCAIHGGLLVSIWHGWLANVARSALPASWDGRSGHDCQRVMAATWCSRALVIAAARCGFKDVVLAAVLCAADAEPLTGSSPMGAAAPFVEQPVAQAGPGSLVRPEQHTQSEDTWVTVYGFMPDDLPLVLKEFQRCGDILQWGTFGSGQTNFIHIQYQNKYGAQRAQLRCGDELGSTLIIGVKPLAPKHRAQISQWGSTAEGSPGRMKAATGPVRPYRVELPQAQVLPHRSRSWAQKVGEYVFGL